MTKLLKSSESSKVKHSLYGGRVIVETGSQARYRVLVDEKPVKAPSVTSITGQLSKGDALIYWATDCMAKYLLELDRVTNDDILRASKEWRALRDEAANFGKAVHDYAEQFAKSLTTGIAIPVIEGQEEVRNGINAFLSFMDEYHVQFKETESVIYSLKNNYVGRIDALAEVDGKLTLIDYKTSRKSKVSPNGIYDEARMQVIGYKKAIEEEKNIKIPRVLILRFDKQTGELGYEFIENHEKWDQAFMGLLQTRHALCL